QGQLRLDDHLYRGRVGAGFAATFPSPVTIAVLEHGRERYDIFCAPCHDRTGSGRGMIVERGYRAPTSFHIDRLRQAPPGYLFDVITRGFGAMPDYAEQISVRDRWSIVAYLRALQLSQDTRKEELSPEERRKLEAETP
ncbi:MAG TPA: cytochrome c, partial [Candidatus Saccharimonadales bacterium]|nr:cytochrome c [Candidatus Saccharimonadales bacterium]